MSCPEALASFVNISLPALQGEKQKMSRTLCPTKFHKGHTCPENQNPTTTGTPSGIRWWQWLGNIIFPRPAVWPSVIWTVLCGFRAASLSFLKVLQTFYIPFKHLLSIYWLSFPELRTEPSAHPTFLGFFDGTGVWTQGLAIAKHGSTTCAMPPALFSLDFFQTECHIFVQGGAHLDHELPCCWYYNVHHTLGLFVEMGRGVSITFCQAWAWTDLLTSASWVIGNTGVSHHSWLPTSL
jgi:hypothetical protein